MPARAAQFAEALGQLQAQLSGLHDAVERVERAHRAELGGLAKASEREAHAAKSPSRKATEVAHKVSLDDVCTGAASVPCNGVGEVAATEDASPECTEAMDTCNVNVEVAMVNGANESRRSSRSNGSSGSDGSGATTKPWWSQGGATKSSILEDDDGPNYSRQPTRQKTLSKLEANEEPSSPPPMTISPIWLETPQHRPSRNYLSEGSTSSWREPSAKEERDKRVDACSKRLVMRPDCRKRIVWVMTGMSFIFYDFFSLPFQVFDPPTTLFTHTMTWGALIFWLLDVPITFITGFFDRSGFTEMRMVKIAQKYASGWLAYDLILVSSDWAITIITQSDTSSLSQLRMGRALRFMRMIRLARIVKVQGRMKDLVDNIRSEECLIILGIFKLLFFIMILNHLVACGWFGMGKLSRSMEFSRNWIEENDLDDSYGNDIFYQYMTSLHWSWTQFTPASMEVVPRNGLERLYNVLIVIFAMVTFSSFVSSITNAMTRLRIVTAERAENQSLLRTYMTENNISDGLCTSVSDFLLSSEKESKKSRKKEKDVPLLKKLPHSLRVRLQDEVYLPHITQHPFFMAIATFHLSVMHSLYKEALEELTTPLGHHLFEVGHVAKSMLFVITGELTYRRPNVVASDESLRPRQWMCEAALWVQWNHVGECFAPMRADLLSINAQRFQTMVVQEMSIREPARYAAAFTAHFLNNPEQALTDVWVDRETQKLLTCEAFKADSAWFDLTFTDP